ncbi:DUF3180 domain-containing protein [Nocardioides perillae]|uniref:DUF3180 domain-containing protein n=1 Tax=Nocardioides perillae TaxID=1119534 RepID=A0A7Y9RNW5_9ACTN|nr:hypothetical protein [Nocardioides perillae]
MTSLPPGRPGPPGQPGDPEPPRGTLRPTTGAVLAPWAGAGLVGGWLLRPVGVELLGSAPPVLWRQVAALGLLALLVGLVARVTHRALQVRGERLEPHQAVSRLVLARASALVGALTAGGYTGYAVSWLGLTSERADGELLRSLAAAAAAVALVAVALLLERACRVPPEDRDA